MKEAIGGVSLFGIVIFFILVFTGIMCLTINRSRAYEVKDQIVTAIEENGGYDINNTANNQNGGLIDDIVSTMADSSYRTTGTCPSGYDLALDREGYITSNDNASLCIKQTIIEDDAGIDTETYKCYYTIMVFYKLDIPVLESVFSFKISGQTKTIYSTEYCWS